jgi:glycosyltransferase involved in cell wall biosynthesis
MRSNDSSFGQPDQILPQKLDPKRRVKLVFLIRSLGIGGAERQLVTLAASLDPAVFDVTVLCFYGGGELGQELADAKIPLVSLEKKGRWDVQNFLWRLRSTLKRIQPDVIYSYLTVANLMATLLMPSLPSTRVVWGIRATYDLAYCTPFDRLCWRLEKLLSHFPDLIIFNSFAGRDLHLSDGYAGSRAVVIHNGMDTKRFRPDRRSGSLLRATWQIPDGALLIGMGARLDPMKDHQTFLRAARIFARTRPEARFVCIGRGPQQYFDELRDLAERLDVTDKVVWPGSIGDMASGYNALDISCSSSCYGEGTSNAVAEAMACGVPCVVTDVGDSKLIVGDTGIVVPPRNPEALAIGWARMAARLTDFPSIRQEARTRIETEFSLAALVSRTSDSLLELL